jgi:hypothetical protein
VTKKENPFTTPYRELNPCHPSHCLIIVVPKVPWLLAGCGAFEGIRNPQISVVKVTGSFCFNHVSSSVSLLLWVITVTNTLNGTWHCSYCAHSCCSVCVQVSLVWDHLTVDVTSLPESLDEKLFWWRYCSQTSVF